MNSGRLYRFHPLRDYKIFVGLKKVQYKSACFHLFLQKKRMMEVWVGLDICASMTVTHQETINQFETKMEDKNQVI